MRPGRIAWVGVLVAAALLPGLAPGLAYAGGPSTDAAEAQALFEEGRRLMASHDYAAACSKFAGSEEREPAAGTALNLAVCYETAGKLASAWAAFKMAESLASNAGQKDRMIAARKKGEQLREAASRLTVTVPPSAQVPGLEVQRDGAVLPSAEWGVAVPRDGGGHDVRASAPGKKAWTRHVDLQPRGEGVVVEVPPLEDAPPPPAPAVAKPAVSPPGAGAPFLAPAPAEERPPGRAQRIVGLSAFAAGIVGMGVGGVLGLEAKSQDRTAAGEPGTARHTDSASAVSTGNAATAVVVIGAVVAATGAVVWLVAPGRRAESSVGVGTDGQEIFLRRAF